MQTSEECQTLQINFSFQMSLASASAYCRSLVPVLLSGWRMQPQPRLLAPALARGVHIENKIKELGLILPAPVDPKGNYIACTRDGNTLYLCGHLPVKADGTLYKGKVGASVSKEEAYQAAQACALGLVSTLQNQLGGNLDKVDKVLKVLGFVNAVPEFVDHPAVVNGASDTIVKIFGDAGKHARSAVGAGSLPLGVSVEVEMIVKVK